ncbi:DEKNAAC102468 [Brettanomyces naardenensis]|uniref:ATPase expression protein 1 n=1 Tax=Brettanomyces naardenensis TaxID=13370 RepID=A0A448YKD9_BRENA|nr:DEKNAAC102468 [Brettanomyces naardenensis]
MMKRFGRGTNSLFIRSYSLGTKEATQGKYEGRVPLDLTGVLSEPLNSSPEKGNEIASKGKHIPTLEQKEVYRTPFLSFNYTDCLNIALTNQSQSLFTRYEDYIGIKDNQIRDYSNPSKNLLDLMLEYPRRSQLRLTVLQNHFTSTHVSLPSSFQQETVSQLLEASTLGNVQQVIESLDKRLDRYTVANIISGMFDLLLQGDLSRETVRGPVNLLSEYISLQVVEFDLLELESLICQLALYGDTEEVKLIVSSFDKINEPNRTFLSSASQGLKLELFDAYTRGKDFQSAFKVFESLVAVNKSSPPAQSIENYLDLVSATANSIKSNFKNKKFVFNAYSAPVAYSLRLPGVLNERIAVLIMPWLTENEFPWFVNYLRLSPDYGKVVRKFSFSLIETYGKCMGTHSGKSSSDKAISLTAFINQMEIPLDTFDDATKELISKLYAKFKSPLAARLWLDKLHAEPSDECTQEITRLLNEKKKVNFTDSHY